MVGEHLMVHLASNWIIEGRSVERPWRDRWFGYRWDIVFLAGRWNSAEFENGVHWKIFLGKIARVLSAWWRTKYKARLIIQDLISRLLISLVFPRPLEAWQSLWWQIMP